MAMGRERWIDDVKQWPKLTDAGIQEHFINRLACDEQQNKNYRALIEGQNYLSSGWIGQILHVIADEIIKMKSLVRFSQTINSYHNVSVTINRGDGKILEVECDCMAGRGKCCSHTAGLLYKVKDASVRGFTGLACTDTACAWNRSTCDNVVPETVENMQTPSGPKKSMSAISTAFESDENVIAHFSAPDMIGLAMVPGTILHHVLSARPQTAQPDPPKEHTMCAEQKCTLCTTTFQHYVQCGEQDRQRLEKETMGQNSQLWLDQRKIRITSSEASEVPKKADPTNWVERKLNTKFSGNEATRYGQHSEPLARQCFEQTTGLTVETTGLIVHEQDNWLGASLDGIIGTDTILEIKCPTPKKLEAHGGSLFKMIESNKYDVRESDGKYYLRETASGLGYYYQVQVAMHCAKKNICKFMVWTPNEHVIVDVPYNEEWTMNKISHLKCVYFQYLLPAVSTRIAHGVMKVCGLK